MGLKILVISSDAKFCEAVKPNLEKETCVVQLGMKSDTVLTEAQAFKPEGIIVDISDSSFNSCEAAYKIQNDQKLYKAKIIFLSMFAKKADVEMYAGIVNGSPFMAKPIHPKTNKARDLLQWIEAAPPNPQPPPPPE